MVERTNLPSDLTRMCDVGAFELEP